MRSNSTGSNGRAEKSSSTWSLSRINPTSGGKRAAGGSVDQSTRRRGIGGVDREALVARHGRKSGQAQQIDQAGGLRRWAQPGQRSGAGAAADQHVPSRRLIPGGGHELNQRRARVAQVKANLRIGFDKRIERRRQQFPSGRTQFEIHLARPLRQRHQVTMRRPAAHEQHEHRRRCGEDHQYHQELNPLDRRVFWDHGNRLYGTSVSDAARHRVHAPVVSRGARRLPINRNHAESRGVRKPSIRARRGVDEGTL